MQILHEIYVTINLINFLVTKANPKDFLFLHGIKS